MFDVYCPGHGSRVLMFPSDIEAIRNTREGIEVIYRCFCGYEGVWHSGRARKEGGELCERPVSAAEAAG